MTARVARLVGTALVWTVLGVAATVGLLVCLPVLLVAAVLRGLYEVGRALIRRGEMSGADDLDDSLRAEIDGNGEVFACGCLNNGVIYSCITCGWKSCWDHKDATHLCERDPVRDWAHEWPTNRIKPADLDTSAAEPNQLLTEIYDYLESAQ